jgi:tetratricopeptide (TPR) repeat protein
MFSTIVFLVMVALAVFGSSLNTSLSNALKISNIEVRPSMTVTLDIARNTLMSRPLFGSGPNTFVTQWLSFKPDDIVSTIFWNTDFSTGIGLIPTLVVTTGLMGLISWILFIGFFVYLGFSSIFARIDDHFLRFSLLSSFFSSVFLWTMTFLYVPGVVVLVLTFFVTGLFFASVFAAGIVPISPKIFSYSPRVGFIASIVMVAAVLGFIALGYGLFRNSQSLWLYQKSFQALNAGNLQEAEDYMGKAINTVPQDIYYRGLSEIEIYKMSAIIQQDPKKVDPVEIQKQFSAALSTGIKSGMSATNADSSNYLNWISLARVYESVSDPALKINGAYESAATAYGEALRRNPKNPGIFVLLSRLAFTRQDMTAAQNYALQAIQLKRNYTDAYFLLAQIQVAQKDIKSAIESVTAATVIDPTNSGSFFQLGLLKFSSGDYNGAIDAFNKAINLTPNYANAQYYLGLAYEITGNHQKAIDIFTALSQTNPDSVEVANILSSLKAGKSLFGSNQQAPVSKKAVKPPIKESAQ